MKRRTKWILSLLIALVAVGWGVDAVRTSMKPAVGILEINGIITESLPYLDTIKQFEQDDKIKAVVVRLDSPGGKVGPSQEVYGALLRLKKKKPLLASLGSLGASGAYYIACATDTVYALPGTMTGSIGVIMEMFDASEGLKRIGVTPNSITAGTLKDAGSPFKPMSEQERAYFKDLVDDVHSQFIEAVSSGRNMEVDAVRRLADGRVFTGRQAKGAGLVDRLGGLDEAVEDARKKAHIEGEPRIIRSEGTRGVWDAIRRIIPWDTRPFPFRGDPSEGLGMGRQVRLDYSIQ
ncbi:MAG TPA: signal peptide peptidase SppA [Deltaproteobacteria bacterium]|jgi:protease-4|nr:MAG: putative signal peptide peptidase SppA [Deltaproteobacteria bacterium ADurb.Bin072]HNQ86013.1 signal peptide peptidase SppA [Deltaproteobacteria bacterium]HRW80806.1 signal peptide peptidase SppA [Desulfomonilia bacterium]HNS90371.1 signal peptide peptidase SppA [Deltaproteobacteria bacterium]HOA44642.1 signal peptide peptidase SppA [Deltaproteobacteria bacterium]